LASTSPVTDAATVTVPRSVNLSALPTRLRTTCPTSVASVTMGGSGPGSVQRSSTSGAVIGRSTEQTSVMSAAMSTSAGEG
jgi:hypothetical protein